MTKPSTTKEEWQARAEAAQQEVEALREALERADELADAAEQLPGRVAFDRTMGALASYQSARALSDTDTEGEKP
jgi:ABC-type nitrate/sulfonate/bicarbonate transport system substrate-binding protein